MLGLSYVLANLLSDENLTLFYFKVVDPDFVRSTFVGEGLVIIELALFLLLDIIEF